jgi:hypothetical protein
MQLKKSSLHHNNRFLLLAHQWLSNRPLLPLLRQEALFLPQDRKRKLNYHKVADSLTS